MPMRTIATVCMVGDPPCPSWHILSVRGRGTCLRGGDTRLCNCMAGAGHDHHDTQTTPGTMRSAGPCQWGPGAPEPAAAAAAAGLRRRFVRIDRDPVPSTAPSLWGPTVYHRPGAEPHRQREWKNSHPASWWRRQVAVRVGPGKRRGSWVTVSWSSLVV